jgi:hypothetical protein
MKHAALVVKLLLFSYLGYLGYFLLATEGPAAPGYHPPFVIFVLDTINLFIHEAGHFFLKPFGMWVYIFGGSFMQCFLPLLLAFVTWKQNITGVPLPAFWFGENLINVSYYIKDAPFKQLKLIASGLIHDWNWLLSGNLDAAGTLGEIVAALGFFVCVGAVGGGVFFAVRDYRNSLAAPH